MHTEPQLFKPQVKAALANPVIRKNFRGAMDFLRAKRKTVLPDDAEFKQLQQVAELTKKAALQQLPDLLEQLEAKCLENGIKVHWAQTTAEANDIVLGIIDAHQGTSVVKGKSMVSEEVGMNAFLERHGKSCIESDMGEYIVQLANEHPSHIIMPAIHKNAEEIGQLFADNVPDTDFTTDVDTLINVGRTQLRQRFMSADIGVTGVNFAVAETGTLCLVENEGNGRMTSTVPPVHIAITGIEKVVPSLADIPALLSLLTRSATGQVITTYFNMITSPRKMDERDGPQEIHLVLLDNGRSQAYADEQFRDTLQCIRCGACMNHCPVYTRIGGHAYGTVYPGPIGKIISPHLLGLEDTPDLPTASSLCGACEEVCPVNIPIPTILQRLRAQANAGDNTPKTMRGAGSSRKKMEAFVWKFWSWLCVSPANYHRATWLSARFRGLVKFAHSPWTQCRSNPIPAPKTLNELIKDRLDSQQSVKEATHE